MLSDGLCLVVALVAIKISKKSVDAKVLSEKNTFGWSRSEILGNLLGFLLGLFKRTLTAKSLHLSNTNAFTDDLCSGSLINAVFLLALCVILILESIEKFIQVRFSSISLFLIKINLA